MKNKLKEFEAVVFDMDGVIFDSERCVLECWVLLAETYGIPDIEKNFFACTGTTAIRTREIMMEAYGPDFHYDEFARKASVLFHEKYDNGNLPIKSGVFELLEYLKTSKKKIALATSTRKQTVMHELEDAGILGFFDEIITGDMVKHSKPDPEIYLMACQKTDTLPEYAYAIEDSYNGVLSAYRGGLRAIMVPDLLPPNDLMIESTEAILSSLIDVKEYLIKVE